MHNTIIPAGIKRYNKDVDEYNAVAVKTAKKHNAEVIDLHGFVCSITDDLYIDYAHFNLYIRRLQAAYIAGAVMNIDKK